MRCLLCWLWALCSPGAAGKARLPPCSPRGRPLRRPRQRTPASQPRPPWTATRERDGQDCPAGGSSQPGPRTRRWRGQVSFIAPRSSGMRRGSNGDETSSHATIGLAPLGQTAAGPQRPRGPVRRRPGCPGAGGRRAARGHGATEAPYGGTAAAVPGTVQAANYDTGGQGVAYNVGGCQRFAPTATGPTGSTWRPPRTRRTPGGAYDIGWTTAGQWFNYTVNVATAGTYGVASGWPRRTGSPTRCTSPTPRGPT